MRRIATVQRQIDNAGVLCVSRHPRMVYRSLALQKDWIPWAERARECRATRPQLTRGTRGCWGTSRQQGRVNGTRRTAEKQSDSDRGDIVPSGDRSSAVVSFRTPQIRTERYPRNSTFGLRLPHAGTRRSARMSCLFPSPPHVGNEEHLGHASG